MGCQTDRKKILMIATVPSMIGQFNMGNIQLLQEMGYVVEVGCNFEDTSAWDKKRIKKFIGELKQKNVICHQLDFTRNATDIIAHLKVYRHLVSIISENEYSFLHCHTPIASVIGRIAAHKYKLKVIYTAHGFHFFKGAPIKNWILYYPVEKFLSRWTDVLITINKEDYERAKKKFHAKRVEYIPGVGIDINRFEQCDERKVDRELLGIPEDAIILLSVGELNNNKNQEVVIKALAEIGSTNIYYILCGQGDKREYLESLTVNLGIRERVLFQGFCEDIVGYYKISDIFVFPSKREGLPVALMEAMICGLPCVVSNVRGNRDLIQNGQNGYICKHNMKREYKKWIELLSEKENKRTYFGMQAVESIKNYSKEVVIKKMEKIYEREDKV